MTEMGGLKNYEGLARTGKEQTDLSMFSYYEPELFA
jgi:hypothetical protein